MHRLGSTLEAETADVWHGQKSSTYVVNSCRCMRGYLTRKTDTVGGLLLIESYIRCALFAPLHVLKRERLLVVSTAKALVPVTAIDSFTAVYLVGDPVQQPPRDVVHQGHLHESKRHNFCVRRKLGRRQWAQKGRHQATRLSG